MNFPLSGLLPAIIQDAANNEVLMLGYVNQESLDKTLETKTMWFYSRSKKRLWQKGESSGNILRVHEIYYDCDEDTFLIKATQMGNATCHTGHRSCFFQKIELNRKRTKF